MRIMRNKYEKLIVVTLLSLLICLNLSWISRSSNVTNYSQKCQPSKFESNSNSISHQLISKAWTRISSKVFVYSAYIEDRQNGGKSGGGGDRDGDGNGSSPYIKIIGIKRVKNKLDDNDRQPSPTVQDITKAKDQGNIRQKYFCKLHYVENNEFKYIVSTNISYFVFEEGVKLYAGTFYKCYFNHIPKLVESSTSSSELFVSLHPRNVTGYPDKLVRVQRHRRKFKTDLSVCIRPLFGPMDDLEKLVQFLAYYEAMGASHFTFYDLSISPRIRNYLKKLGGDIVSLFQWNLPTGNVSELWDYGTLTALQDCVYQSKGLVIIVDIDEFIVSRENSTLLEFLSNPSYAIYDQFCFRNVFFCDELCPSTWNPHSERTLHLNSDQYRMINQNKDSTLVMNEIKDVNTKIKSEEGDTNFTQEKHKSSFFMSSSSRFHSVVQAKTSFPIFACSKRTKKIWGVFNRAKYITRAEKVFSVGHHFVTTFTYSEDPRYSKFTWKVPTTLALLHHYRKCGPLSSKANPIFKRAIVTDEQIFRFREKVASTRSYKIYEESRVL